MQTKAVFQRKLAEMETQDCEIEKVIRLTESEYAAFYQKLLGNYDFIQENDDIMGVKDGVAHCILVTCEELNEGILVNSSGNGYARNVAYFPNVNAFLNPQQVQTVRQAEQPVAVKTKMTGFVASALTAYGERLGKFLDQCIEKALDKHDDATYVFTFEELAKEFTDGGFDRDVFATMVGARSEVVDLDVTDQDIMMVLSLETIQEHADSKLRVLSQDDVIIMHARHTLWTYGVGGDQAVFTGCRLSGLDMHEYQFNGADFRGALIENCDLRNMGACSADLRGARFVNCEMECFTAEESDFSETSFRDCHMRAARLAGSTFQNVILMDSDLSKTDLSNATVKQVEVQDSEMEDVNLRGADVDDPDWVQEMEGM